MKDGKQKIWQLIEVMAKGWKIRNYGIICKHFDAGEFFFGADHKVYPCCYLFDDEVSKKWNEAYKLLGIDPNNLSFQSGNA